MSLPTVVQFVSNRVCPFAHRAWLSLEFHKQAGALDYEVKSASVSRLRP